MSAGGSRGLADLAAIRVLVFGFVQGVFFRDFTAQHARGLGVAGYVRNLPDGSVEVFAEGERGSLGRLIEHLKIGPPRAVVKNIDVSWSAYSGEYTDFTIKY